MGRSGGHGTNNSWREPGNKFASFDVSVVAPDGATQRRSGLRWELSKVETRYQWYRADWRRWSYEAVKSTRRIASGNQHVLIAAALCGIEEPARVHLIRPSA